MDSKTARDPHALSASFSVDPAYSAAGRLPKGEGLSLFSEKTGGPFWLYLPGDLATHLFNRMRREAFATCKNIFHPGVFQNPRPTLYANRRLKLEDLPQNAVLKLYCSGQATLRVNDDTLFSREFSSKPEAAEIETRPFLRKGDNEIRVTVHSLGAPCALLLKGGFLETDGEWLLSEDAIRWATPERLPCEGLARFPHQEGLPDFELTAKPIGNGCYDFGTETFGRLSVKTKAQTAPSLTVGESLEEAKSSDVHTQEQIPASLKNKDGRWSCDANLSLRYVHVKGEGVEALSLSAPTYPASYKGAFACSDDALTAIWMRSAYTLRLCMRALCVDGLKRDRLPWGGDLYMSSLVNACSFHDRELIRRSMVPLYGEGLETMDVNNIADYSLFWPMTARDQLMNYGDIAFAKRILPRLERLFGAFERRADAEGLLPTLAGQWVFIDWSEVEKKGHCTFIQMLYAMALDAMAEILEALGEPAKAQTFVKKATSLRHRCDKAFWSERQGAYVDNREGGVQGEKISRPANIFAILSDVASPKKAQAIAKSLLLKDTVKAVGTPYMRAFEGQALAKCGESAALLEIIRSDWGGMIEKGATTFWEGYDKHQNAPTQYSFYGRPFGKSLCHAWSAGPAHLLSTILTGAKPLAPGWTRFSVEPSAGGLAWVSTVLPSPQGPIKVEVADGEAHVFVPTGATLVAGAREHSGPCVATLKARGY